MPLDCKICNGCAPGALLRCALITATAVVRLLEAKRLRPHATTHLGSFAPDGVWSVLVCLQVVAVLAGCGGSFKRLVEDWKI